MRTANTSESDDENGSGFLAIGIIKNCIGFLWQQSAYRITSLYCQDPQLRAGIFPHRAFRVFCSTSGRDLGADRVSQRFPHRAIWYTERTSSGRRSPALSYMIFTCITQASSLDSLCRFDFFDALWQCCCFFRGLLNNLLHRNSCTFCPLKLLIIKCLL